MPQKERTAKKTRLYHGEDLQERRQRRRSVFLDAGLELFGTVGYRATTVRMLCKEAGLTDRYFYESFESTEDLLIAVYIRGFEQIQNEVFSAVLKVITSGKPLDAVKAGLSALFDRVTDPRIVRAVWLEVMGVSPKVDAVYNEKMNGFASLILNLARHFVPHWQPDEDVAFMLAVGAIGAIRQMVAQWLLSKYRVSKAVMIEAATQLFLGLLTTIEGQKAIAKS